MHKVSAIENSSLYFLKQYVKHRQKLALVIGEEGKGKGTELSISYKDNPVSIAHSVSPESASIEPAEIGPSSSFCDQHDNQWD